MTKKIECEFYLAIDACCDWSVSEDVDNAMDGKCGAVRIIKFTAHVTPPTTEELTVDVPEATGQAATVEIA